jgi:hypothetical protein
MLGSRVDIRWIEENNRDLYLLEVECAGYRESATAAYCGACKARGTNCVESNPDQCAFCAEFITIYDRK